MNSHVCDICLRCPILVCVSKTQGYCMRSRQSIAQEVMTGTHMNFVCWLGIRYTFSPCALQQNENTEYADSRIHKNCSPSASSNHPAKSLHTAHEKELHAEQGVART
jgi:hypothetical protein